MRLARRGFALAALTALTFVAACGSDSNDNGGGTAQDLSGTYSLVKFEQQISGTYTEIPGVTGSFVLTATTYTVTISDIPLVGSISDEGTYTAVGTATSGEFSQNSTAGGTQATGNYTYDTATGILVLSTVVNGVNQRLTLQKD